MSGLSKWLFRYKEMLGYNDIHIRMAVGTITVPWF